MPTPRSGQTVSRKGTDRTARIGRGEPPLLERITIRRHVYLLRKELGGPGRARYLASDPDAGGESRLILILPRSEAAVQNVRVLKRLPPGNVNLPRLLNYETRRDEMRLVLTWVPGPTLATALEKIASERARPVSLYESIRLIRGLAHGLRALHDDAQLVHGDLTPANLVLKRKTSYLAMIDFGSAWRAERSALRGPTDGATPVYAAPELQADDRPVDFRCDQFSASVIAYQLLTGRIPYADLGGKAGWPQYVERMKGDLVVPSKLCRKRPGAGRTPRSILQAVDRVVTTGLALDPDDRHPTPRAWVDQLDAVYLEMQYLARRRTPERGPVTRVLDWLADRFSGDDRSNELSSR